MPSTEPERAAWREALGLTLVALVYSNGLAVLAMRRGTAADLAYRWTNPFFLPLLIWAVARARRVPVRAVLRACGVQTAGGPVALAGGLLLGTLLSLPPLIFFARPLVLDAPLEYGRIGDLSRRAFWLRVLFELPVGVALFEELLFRGLLTDSWARAVPPPAAHAASAAAFAGWHFMVGLDTMRHTNIQAAATRVPRFMQTHANAIGVVGGMGATGVAGILLSLLRARGRGNIFGPTLAHWIADSAMVIALHRRAQGKR
jgi:membrane protease YdiL (CAAX protease family)